MPAPPRIGDLEVHQDLQHERREWRIERAAWIAMLLLALAALAGLLGPGPLSRDVAGVQGSALWVEHNQRARRQAPEVLRVHAGPDAVRDARLRLSISSGFIARIELRRIEPEPLAVEVAVDRLIYTFAVAEAPVTVLFHYEPKDLGRARVSLSVDPGTRLDFEQFVFP